MEIPRKLTTLIKSPVRWLIHGLIKIPIYRRVCLRFITCTLISSPLIFQKNVWNSSLTIQIMTMKFSKLGIRAKDVIIITDDFLCLLPFLTVIVSMMARLLLPSQTMQMIMVMKPFPHPVSPVQYSLRLKNLIFIINLQISDFHHQTIHAIQFNGPGSISLPLCPQSVF